MRVSKIVIYCNILSLTVNGILVWLMLVKLFPPMLGILIFLGCLAGAVWLSCYTNGRLPKKARQGTLYAAPTENIERF